MPAVVIMGSPLLASVMAGPPLKLSSPKLVKQLQTLAQGTARRVGLLILFLFGKDLRVRIVRAVQEESISKSAAARLFGVSLSSVKRYVRMADRGTSLAPRKGGGRPPKADETTRRLLEEDVKERPAATVTQRRHL